MPRKTLGNDPNIGSTTAEEYVNKMAVFSFSQVEIVNGSEGSMLENSETGTATFRTLQVPDSVKTEPSGGNSHAANRPHSDTTNPAGTATQSPWEFLANPPTHFVSQTKSMKA